MVDPMPSAVAPNRSGARRLWDTDPFLLLDWESPEWAGPASADHDRTGSGQARGAGAAPAAALWEQQSVDWAAMERATWDTGERAVLQSGLAELSSMASTPVTGAPRRAVPPPEAGFPAADAPGHAADTAWAGTPEWLLPDWLVASEPYEPARSSNPGDDGSVPLPRRRDLRAARANGSEAPLHTPPQGIEAFPVPPRPTPAPSLPSRREMRQAERAGTAPLPRRRDLRGAPAPAQPRQRRLASVALGSVAARVAVLTVLGAVGVGLVSGTHPDFLSLEGKGLADAAAGDMSLRGGHEPSVEPAALTAAQADYTARVGKINAEIAVEDRTTAAITLARKLAASREAARIRAAEKAAAKARAEAMAQAVRSAQRNPKAVGKLLAAERGWTGSQWQCLDNLWTRESHWNYKADNPSSSAYGIPQALPGSKMSSAGSDWQTNPVTQIKWGLNYIADRYGTPCGAWAHSEDVGWY